MQTVATILQKVGRRHHFFVFFVPIVLHPPPESL
jgi:hypothetical protein